MTAIPTVKVTNGENTFRINESEATEWLKKGFKPVTVIKARGKETPVKPIEAPNDRESLLKRAKVLGVKVHHKSKAETIQNAINKHLGN